MRLSVALLWLVLSFFPAVAQTASNTLPGVGTILNGCVEGRALRIVGGAPSCASTAPPTLYNCGSGTIDASATDFIGQVTLPAGGLTSCTVVMTKLYSNTFICVFGAQTTGLNLGLTGAGSGSTTINGTAYTSFAVPFSLTLGVTKFGYICGPG